MTSADHEIMVASRPIHRLSGDLSKLALLVIDMQNFFAAEGQAQSTPYVRGIIPRISALTTAVRQAGGTVAWSRHTTGHAKPHITPRWFDEILGDETAKSLQALVPGSWAHAVLDEFDVASHDIVIDKYRPSSFFPETTGLHAKLSERGIEDLMVVGTVTNFCCQSTARDAIMLDYRVFFVSDSTAAHSDAIHNTTLADLSNMLFFDIRSTQEILAEIQRRQDAFEASGVSSGE